MKSIVIIAVALIAALPWGARAADADWAALERPGSIILMRHALAPGGGDPDGFRLDDCSTQRNLDARGRAQARAIGAALRQRGVTEARVLSSQWCRCRETAELLDVGPVEDLPALNSFFDDRSTEPEQTAAIRAFLSEQPAAPRLVLVTHQVNITALTEVFPSSGEIIVIDVDDAGQVAVLGEILIRP